jgi:hypothetical protein
VTILQYFSRCYYCVALMILFTVAALVTSIVYYRRHSSLRIFTYYIAFSLLESIGDCYYCTSAASKNFRAILLGIAYNAFMLFEFIVFIIFILHYTGSPRRRWIIRIDALLFFGLLVFFAIWKSFLQALEHSYFLVESVFLVLPCLIYFFELFQTVNPRPLKNQPSFWVVTGILFLNACSIPLLLTSGFMGIYKEAAFTLNYILYSVLFILLIRAYICPPEKLAQA